MKNIFKKVVSLFLVGAFVLSFSACSDSRAITTYSERNGNIVSESHVYEPYGWIDFNEKKNPNVEYEIVVGNVIWAIIFSETLIVPVILTGWYLYEPVTPKIPNNLKGVSK